MEGLGSSADGDLGCRATARNATFPGQGIHKFADWIRPVRCRLPAPATIGSCSRSPKGAVPEFKVLGASKEANGPNITRLPSHPRLILQFAREG